MFEGNNTRKLIHQIFSILGWAFFSMFLLFTGRHFKHAWKWAPTVHWIIGILIALATIIGFLPHLTLFGTVKTNFHSIESTIVSILALIECIIGGVEKIFLRNYKIKKGWVV